MYQIRCVGYQQEIKDRFVGQAMAKNQSMQNADTNFLEKKIGLNSESCIVEFWHQGIIVRLN